jgi:hypothetical protein
MESTNIDTIEADVVNHEKLAATFRARSQPDVVEAAIESDLAAFDAAGMRLGVYLPRPDDRQKFEAAKRDAYDEALRAEGRTLEKENTNVVAGIDAVITTLKRPVPEKDPMLKAIQQVAAVQLYRGKTLSALLDLYNSTPDEANRTLIELLELNRDAFDPTLDPDRDAHAVMAWKEAVDKRQHARVPAKLFEVRDRAVAVLENL